jgi:hypothetical protein
LLKEQQVENSGSQLNRFEWQSVVQQALVELDPEKLRAKIAEAESTIFRRLQILGEDGGANAERNALHDASNTLLSLKREVLKFPDWRP